MTHTISSEHYVIIGNGPAANRAADVLRQGDPAGRISIVSDEFFHFYYRHLLAEFVCGRKEESDLVVRPASHYRDNRIRLRLGQAVVKVDFAARTLYLQHMEKLRYTKLLLCVGGKPRVPEIFYNFRRCFTVLKTLADARGLRRQMPDLRHILIIGGDLVSVKLAEVFTSYGKTVTFLLDRDSFWPLELTDDLRQEFAASLGRKGITVIADDPLVAAEPHPAGGYLARTKKGARLTCDLIGAFFGLAPDVDFLLGSGLDIDRGILVNEYLQTSQPGVFAAGDCAQVYNSEIHNYWVSIGWPNAEHLGGLAAHNILGQTVRAGQAEENPLRFERISVTTSWWRQL